MSSKTYSTAEIIFLKNETKFKSGAASIEDSRYPNFKLRIDNISTMDPQELYDKISKLLGKKVARDFFMKCIEHNIFIDKFNIVENFVAS